MGSFKIWCESFESQKLQNLQKIWADAFKALGVGGLSDEDAAQQSLSKITFGGERGSSKGSIFKGKTAVRKRLENGQIFAQLERSNDPELRKNVEDTRRWLDLKDDKMSTNATTTVSTLLQKLFGQDNFQQFIDQDFPKVDQAKAQVPPQPPKDSLGTGGAAPPDGSMTQPPPVDGGMGAPPPAGGPPGAQPQMQPGMMMGQPTNPMPPKPAGAMQGLF